MLYSIITLSLLSVMCVDGIEPETGLPHTVAVSTQSYHRGDVPLSYSITSYHDYTTTKPKKRAPVYGVNNHVPQPTFNSQINQPPLESLQKEELILGLANPYQVQENTLQTTENNVYSYKEPHLLAEHDPFRGDVFRSFVPGHNVAVAPMFKYKSSILNDLYKNYYGSQKIIVPKHVNQDKQIQPLQTQLSKTEREPKHHQNAAFPLIPLHNLPGMIYGPKNVHKHNEILFPQLPPPRAPRLHLNIARVYGVAHIPHQAPESAVTRDKPLSHTQAIIGSQPQLKNLGKTFLYPVKKYKYNQ